MKAALHKFIKRAVRLRSRYFSDRNFLIIAAILVGIVVGLVAVLLKKVVHFIQHQLTVLLEHPGYSILFFVYPLIGMLLTVLFVHKIRRGKLGRGISNIIYSISRRSGNIPPDNTYSHVLSSAITVGFGGSVGLEAPIVVTGSALGSTIARLFMLQQKDRILLLACGASAGIAAVFNTPVAGVLFSMEVLLTEFSIPTFIPVLIAAASGAVVSKWLGAEHLFTLNTQDWSMNALPYYLLLGIVCGLISVYFMKMYFWTERKFTAYNSIYKKAIAGGLMIGALIFFFPPLYGEGYHSIAKLFNGDAYSILQNSLFEKLGQSDIILVFVFGIIIFKVFATAITISAGGNGGVFAPALFLGAFTGYGFSHLYNVINSKQLLEVNFIAAGMAGLVSGIIHAPLTGIFLIAEVTGGYVLFVPLMIVSAIAYFISRGIEPYSIYTGKLAQKGILLDDRETVLLRHLRLSDITDNMYTSLSKEQYVRTMIEAYSMGSASIFPVLNQNKELEGVVMIDDIRLHLLDKENYDRTKVGDIMKKPIYTIDEHDDMNSVMQKFDASGLWQIPIILSDKKFGGFADKKRILHLLREKLSSHVIGID